MHDAETTESSGNDARTVLDDAAERLFDAASAHEDAMMRLLARSADLENRALAEVARFEEQRAVVVDALARLHAAEMGGEDAYEARDRFLGAEAEKNRLWANVESLWAESKRCLVWAGDRQARAARIRDEATRLFTQANAIARDLRPPLALAKSAA